MSGSIAKQDQTDAPRAAAESKNARDIIDSAKKVGGKATRYLMFSEGHYVWELDFSSTKVLAKEIKSIITTIREKDRSSPVIEVRLRKTEIGDEICDTLNLCKPIPFGPKEADLLVGGLYTLDLSCTGVTSNGIKQILTVHRNLFWLDLGALPVDARCLADIGKMELLSTLLLRDTRLEDAAAPRLADTRLRRLDLTNSSIGNGFVKALASSPTKDRLAARLEELNLGGTKITDEAFEQIRQFKNLARLDLSRTSIADVKKIDRLLQSLRKLREINVSKTSLSADGVSRLSEAWPNIKFSR